MVETSKRGRLTQVLMALEGVQQLEEGLSVRELVERTAGALVGNGDSGIWLTLAVLFGRLPRRSDVVDTRRALTRSGFEAGVAALVRRAPTRIEPITIVRDAVLVDVHHTAQTDLATGIQRVVRKTVEQWRLRHSIILVGWDARYSSLRELTPDEVRRTLHGGGPARSTGQLRIVPWNSTFLLPELAIENERTQRIQALAEFSGNATGVIGYDTVPLTSGETTGGGMPAAFARNLRAVADMSRVAAISEAAATEYAGWREMLAGIGLLGPDIRAIGLASEAGRIDDAHRAEAREAFAPDDLPVLLCVGSHEPRKNHLAVLAACEMLWQSGRLFRVVFIGGNGWRGEAFAAAVSRARDKGHPVVTRRAVSEGMLWAAYELATASVFPSLNEGFGLPVAESLLSGTPVVTSDFGSMREIAAPGGALLVDPRDDRAIAAAIDRVLFDPATGDRLRAEARRRVGKSWTTYAEEVWAYLVPR